MKMTCMNSSRRFQLWGSSIIAISLSLLAHGRRTLSYLYDIFTSSRYWLTRPRSRWNCAKAVLRQIFMPVLRFETTKTYHLYDDKRLVLFRRKTCARGGDRADHATDTGRVRLSAPSSCHSQSNTGCMLSSSSYIYVFLIFLCWRWLGYQRSEHSHDSRWHGEAEYAIYIYI